MLGDPSSTSLASAAVTLGRAAKKHPIRSSTMPAFRG